MPAARRAAGSSAGRGSGGAARHSSQRRQRNSAGGCIGCSLQVRQQQLGALQACMHACGHRSVPLRLARPPLTRCCRHEGLPVQHRLAGAAGAAHQPVHQRGRQGRLAAIAGQVCKGRAGCKR